MAQHQSQITASLCSLLTLALVKVEDVKVCLFASAKQHRLFLKQTVKGTGAHGGDSLALSWARSLESSSLGIFSLSRGLAHELLRRGQGHV